MAAMRQSITVGGSSIERLPAELLEKILLDAVAESNRPVWHDNQLRKVFRWHGQYKRGQPTGSQFLKVCLVCHKSRDAAWRAFGRVLGETMFDLGSRVSIYNLHAAFEQPELTPWIRKLPLTCNIFYRMCKDMRMLSPDALDELHSVQEREYEWIEDAYSEILRLLLGTASLLTETDSVTRICAANMRKTFKTLTNIEIVVYVWDQELLPQHYMKAWLLDTRVYSRASACRPEAFGAHFGITVIIEALATAGIQLKSLSLTVRSVRANSIVVPAASTSVALVCEKVESPALRGRYYPVDEHSDFSTHDPTVAVTKTIFPLFRSLVVDYDHVVLYIRSMVPTPEDTPELRYLTIINSPTHEHPMEQLLKYYGSHLMSLSLLNYYLSKLAYVTKPISHLDL